MKTIRISDRLYSKVRQKAKSEGCTVDGLVARELDAALSRNTTKHNRRVRPPIIRSKRPGTLHLDNARIFEIIDFP